ncbi:HAD family hydrolase [Schlesneria sp. DSM 10557]|uniref:HAD family hydrolase n=1 Tax=Schlesneria sp. DSM 10557 TaxID=3044399 RepID=UPI0035A0997E
MAKTLLEYAELLDGRNLRWPAPPKIVPVPATPSLKPLPGIRAVTWNLYGTLLRITDGELVFQHPQALRMEVAIEKTIDEFNMWNSMTRRPGKPSDLLLPKYLNAIEEIRLRSSNKKGDLPEVDAAQVWHTLLEMLHKKDYSYDESLYGSMTELAQKVAYFFHSSLQGTEATPAALDTLNAIAAAGLRQAALADAQCFTLVQLTRALRHQGNLFHVTELLPESLNTLSYEWGICKPSLSLYAQAILRFKEIGIEPSEILHVGTRIQGDLAPAKACGFQTVLLADDKTSLAVTPEDLKNPETRPHRLITELPQLREILQI